MPAHVRKESTEHGEARRAEILAAALRVFSEVGYTKATTKRIADAAGLRSPGLIYWYFPNKQELLRAVFFHYAVVLRTGTTRADAPLEIAPDEFLRRAASGGLAFFEDPLVRQVYRLYMCEWPLLEKLGIHVRASELPDNVYDFIERYLRRQAELGVLRPHDSAAAARSFVSQIWAQVEARHLFPSIYPIPPENDVFVEQLVDLFLGGLLARD